MDLSDVFRKNLTEDNPKSDQKPGLHSLENIVLEKL